MLSSTALGVYRKGWNNPEGNGKEKRDEGTEGRRLDLLNCEL